MTCTQSFPSAVKVCVDFAHVCPVKSALCYWASLSSLALRLWCDMESPVLLVWPLNFRGCTEDGVNPKSFSNQLCIPHVVLCFSLLQHFSVWLGTGISGLHLPCGLRIRCWLLVRDVRLGFGLYAVNIRAPYYGDRMMHPPVFNLPFLCLFLLQAGTIAAKNWCCTCMKWHCKMGPYFSTI